MKRKREEDPVLTASFDTHSDDEAMAAPTAPLSTILEIESSVEEAEADDLSPSQRRALELVLAGRNVFVTGAAGTGKSHLIERIKAEFDERGTHLAVTAMTGSAAWNIEGLTLHAFAGMGLAQQDAHILVAALRKRKDKVADWQWVQALIIDEVSMLTVDFFEKLNVVARELKDRSRPFGGLQLILVGDYFQCPPIIKDDKKKLQQPPKPKYLFQCPLWQSAGIQVVYLVDNFRQAGDTMFQAMLERIKCGRLAPTDETTLRGRLLVRHPDADVTGMIKLCSYRASAERINREEMAKLDGECHSFKGRVVVYDQTGQPIVDNENATEAQREELAKRLAQQSFPVDQQLDLKVGALVLLCYNLDVGGGLYNGARGRVREFRPLDNLPGAPLFPVVEFESGQTIIITPHKWEQKKKGRVVSTFEQVPLMLRYAVTIHKAQGLTLERVLVTMDFFETGLAYVAFSRVRRLDDLFLTNVDMKKILVDQTVVAFYEANKRK